MKFSAVEREWLLLFLTRVVPRGPDEEDALAALVARVESEKKGQRLHLPS